MKYILGGGIAGLLYAFYDPEYTIITDRIGGQFSSDFQLGPKYLHVDEYTKKLFSDLKIEPSIKKIKIGFFYDGDIHKENTEHNRIKYFQKTRNVFSEPYKSVMSASKTEFDSYDIDVEELVKTLAKNKNIKIILEKISNIDLKSKEIKTVKEMYIFEELVSTIPMTVFLFLTGAPEFAKLYQSYPTTFILGNQKDCPFEDFKDFDYVYVSEKEYPYHRITKTKEGIVFEFKGEQVEKMETEKKRVIMPVGQLIQNDDIKMKFDNVKFFGRYATWKHSIKTNELLKEIFENKI